MTYARLLLATTLPDASSSLSMRAHSLLSAEPLAAPTRKGQFELVQYSSGSTADPTLVLLYDQHLGVNVNAILERMELQPGDSLVSWLPLSHDMGLVGVILTGIAGLGSDAVRGEIVLLEPERFMCNPGLWLAAVEKHKATITASPDFGLRWTTQRAPRDSFDLRSLRCVIVGGEIVRADTLATFVSAFAERGFAPNALCPSYGMAELGLAATMTPPQDHWRELTVATNALARGYVTSPEGDEPSVDLVASGTPLTGYQAVHNAGSGRTGTLAVHGGSVGLHGSSRAPLADHDGWYTTGDVGCVDSAGWVYVTGRTNDYIIARSRKIYAPALEARIADLPTILTGRAAVTGLPNGEWVVAAEPTRLSAMTDEEQTRLERDIRREAAKACDAQPDHILLVAHGTVPITPSGKLRRRYRTHMLEGDISAVRGLRHSLDRHPPP